DETGETIPGANVYFEGTTVGSMSDLDGKFYLTTAPGTYNLKLSFISYETITVSEVKVKAAETVTLDNLRLKSANTTLNEVVITAKQVRNTEAALTTLKRKSSSLLDGISATTLKKTGDGDAAASMKRISGVSVSNGKYVYIRGLGDRYTKTILNGMEIPGLDPDRNTIQMDIFPTNILNSIVVYKSFRADLPADFTGGIVNIELKDFPEKRKSNISISGGYNPYMHFDKDFVTYKGSTTDWLGFDNGSREIPAVSNIPSRTDILIDNSNLGRYTEILNKFNPNIAAYKRNSRMDASFAFDYGNQKVKDKYSIGYNFSLSYKNTTNFYKGAEYGIYRKPSNSAIYKLERLSLKTGDIGVNNVLLSGLAGLALKTQNSKYRINFLHLQNGESTASILDQIRNDVGTTYKAYIHNLEYEQRRLTNIIIDGKSVFGDSNWELAWKISPTLSSIYSPDNRTTRYTSELDEDNYIIHGGAGDYPKRIWRDLKEYNISGVTHATRKFQYKGRPAKLKFGGAYTYKERDFVIRQFQIIPELDEYNGDPNEILAEENLWPINGDPSSGGNNGTRYTADFMPDNRNQFNANIANMAGYVSTEIKPTDMLTIITGIRTEKYIQRYTGQGEGTTISDNGEIETQVVSLNNDEVINNLKFFPTINIIYKLTENQNLRFSYAKTIARPSFKEMSYAQINDPLTGNEFNGGMYPDVDKVSKTVYWDGNLVSTDIQNIDLRWEKFFKKSDMLSVSAFYKSFKNPIELFQYTIAANSFQPRNVGNGTILGLEFELRHKLGFVSSFLEDFRFTSNFSYTKSQIKMNEIEYQSRIKNARDAEKIEKYRNMAGMSPYIINAGLQYKTNPESKIEDLQLGLYYNVQGKSLQIVGIADKPDIYTKPFHSLNFNSGYSFGKEKKLTVGLKVSNILDSKKESVYESFEAQNQFFSKRNQRRTYTVKINFKLF
ncbi:MAG: TonB-dependent receptor, partial [Bacteroidota bacterium]|nr:TonB-dependent receptor [Bacteroidota bacterium]